MYDIKWPKLTEGILIRRYRRFIADIKLRNNHIVSAHCPNSGSMMGCSEPGRRVYLSYHRNPRRKFKYTWELIDMGSSLVGINTWVPNHLVRKAIVNGKIEGLNGYDDIRPEPGFGKGTRFDLLLSGKREGCFVEIKNCTLVENGIAYFPDAVTQRGLKHLLELERAKKQGYRAVVFFLIQRMDARRFSPADHIDPEYGRELRRAISLGVEMFVYDVMIDLKGIAIRAPVQPYL